MNDRIGNEMVMVKQSYGSVEMKGTGETVVTLPLRFTGKVVFPDGRTEEWKNGRQVSVGIGCLGVIYPPKVSMPTQHPNHLPQHCIGCGAVDGTYHASDCAWLKAELQSLWERPVEAKSGNHPSYAQNLEKLVANGNLTRERADKFLENWNNIWESRTDSQANCETAQEIADQFVTSSGKYVHNFTATSLAAVASVCTCPVADMLGNGWKCNCGAKP
jgi:hypothetical protein